MIPDISFQEFKLIGIQELARRYGVTERTVRRWRELKQESDAKKPRDIILGDLHTPYMVLQALDFIRRIKQKYELNRLICMGDLVDIHTGGRWGQLPGAHGAKTEWELAVEMIGELTDMFPNALMAIGNHDARAFRAASKMGITDEMIKSINDVYKLPPTWKLYQNFRYNTVYGPCMVMHGHDFSGPGAADKWYNKLHTSVIIGHVHTAPGMRFYQTPDGTRYSAIIPCLADEKSVAMEYAAAFGGCFVNGCAVSVPDLFTFEIIPDSRTGDSL